MKTLLLAILLTYPLLGFAQKSELTLISTSEETETAQLHDGTKEERKVIILKVASKSGTLGPLHLKVEVKDHQGVILTDVMPSFSFVDDKGGRTVYLYIKKDDIKRHIGAVFSAAVSSEGFTPVQMQYQFKEE